MLNFAPGAALDVSPLDELMDVLQDADWRQVGDRNYPPHYFYALGRYRAADEDVARMRRALDGIPRVDPDAYEVLFNPLLRTWDIVKWVPLPEPMGAVSGLGYASRVVLEPIDVYSIPATLRDPSTLGEQDWLYMRRWCTTTRGGDVLSAELRASELRRLAALEQEREAAEHDLAGYLRGLLMRLNTETGLGDLPPDEMARRFGGAASEWAPAEHD
jgi:hypothetical protein